VKILDLRAQALCAQASGLHADHSACGKSDHTSIYEQAKPTEAYIFFRGVSSSDASWPSKARHPVLNLGPFFSLGFFCLLRPRGVRVPVPQRLVRTPRASRRAAANPKHYLPTCTSFFNHGIIVYDKLATRRPSGSTTEHDTQGLT